MNHGQSSIEEKLKAIRREEEEREAARRAARFNLPYLDLRKSPVQLEALEKISEEEARKWRVAPLHFKGRELHLAVYDPSAAAELLKKLEAQNFQTSVSVASLSGLENAWGFYKFLKARSGEITGEVAIDTFRFDALRKALAGLENIKKAVADFSAGRPAASGAGAVGGLRTSEVLEIVLAGALANRASDLHFEPRKGDVVFRLRVDGALHDVCFLEETVYRYLLSRLKLLSGLKVNIRDRAQDGRFSVVLGDSEVEIRTSVIPSEFGETAVMRVLDPQTIGLELAELGLRKDDSEIIKEELKRPNGMILNTGPTGSGKTTTLYAFLKKVYSPEIKMITIEDPIEYQLEGIEQTQVDPEAGYDFSNGLRSILRQDPDVILVGEVRDLETAEIAMHAALTGHLVFSTLHTNDAAGAVPRLIDLGVKPSVIAPAVNLIIAQRLVRRLCSSCRVPKEVGVQEEEKIKKLIAKLPERVDRRDYQEIKIYEPKGCEECGYFGYRGRIAVYELLPVGDDMEEIIIKEPTKTGIETLALKNGMVTMQADGVLKVVSGVTTFDEVEKLTGPIDWR